MTVTGANGDPAVQEDVEQQLYVDFTKDHMRLLLETLLHLCSQQRGHVQKQGGHSDLCHSVK